MNSSHTNFTGQIAGATPAEDFSKQALAKALELGLPNKKNENWKYTNLDKYMPEWDLTRQESFSPGACDKDPRFHNIVFANGAPLSDHCDFPVLSFAQAKEKILAVKTDLKEQLASEFTFLLSEVSDHNQYFIALKGVLEKPLKITHLYSASKAKHAACHLHFMAEQNSQASVVEVHQGSHQDETFANNSASFVLGANSQVFYTKIQAMGKEGSSVENIRAIVKRDARFESVTVDASGKLSRNNIDIVLAEEGAACAAHGLCALSGQERSDTNSFIRHAKGHTESAQLYKGIMADKSNGIFSGVIRMDRDAQLCASEQLNKNLLLSKGAQAHSRPQLEIFADDVKAAHGSTTGQISEEELFYFQARGVSRERAQKLLAHAFLNDVLLKIKNNTIREIAQEALYANFQALELESKA